MVECLIENVFNDCLGHKCLQQCFSILGVLHPNRPVYFSVILSIFKKYMTKILHPADDEIVFDNKTIIFLIDLVWDSIIMSKEFSKDFVAQGCVYLLLDILQVSKSVIGK